MLGAHSKGEAVEPQVATATSGRGRNERAFGTSRQRGACVEDAEAALIAVQGLPAGQGLGQGRVLLGGRRGLAGLWLGHAVDKALLHA